MGKKVSDFSVDSKGYCFLCLKKISCQFTPCTLDHSLDNQPPSIYSLQNISRYLKLYMRKVFIQGGHVPRNLLAKVEKSILKVELCEECSSKTENISKLCRHLEKIKMEIESGLESIHGKMREAEEAGRTEEFRKAMGPKTDSGIGGWMEVLNVLRIETMQKCIKKLQNDSFRALVKQKTGSPRLQIQRLTSREIKRKTFRLPKTEAEITSKQTLIPVLNNSFKTEDENWGLDDNNHDENPFDDNLEGDADDSVSKVVKIKGELPHGRVTNITAILKGDIADTGDGSQRKWSINPKTGKYKCRFCSNDYASSGGVDLHYNTVHRNLRFRCERCGKEFTQKGDHKRHYENVHLGVRFRCKVCQKIFTQKRLLMAHQRNGGCAIGMGKPIH